MGDKQKEMEKGKKEKKRKEGNYFLREIRMGQVKLPIKRERKELMTSL